MNFRRFKSIFPFSFVASGAQNVDDKGRTSMQGHLEVLKKQLKAVETDELLHKVFKKLDRQSREQTIKLNLDYDYAKEHMDRNRYMDIFPYNSNRVRLGGVCAKPGDDYINASYVNHLKSDLNFIVAQGPLPSTRDHFWQMVVEQQCPVIFMLNQPSLHDSVHYFPLKLGESLQIKEYCITVKEIMTDSPTFVLRRLSVAVGTVEHTVIHAHYTGWPDLGVPHDSIAFVTFIKECRKCGLIKNVDKAPPVIHCTAGSILYIACIGRSGVFLVVNIYLEMLKTNESLSADDLNLSNLLLELRKERMFLVQTAQQYKFTLKVLIDIIENNHLL